MISISLSLTVSYVPSLRLHTRYLDKGHVAGSIELHDMLTAEPE